MFMMNVAGLRYSMAAGYLPASPVYASHYNTTSYNTRNGGGGNCTRVPDFATNSGTCGYGNRSYLWSEMGREAESLWEVIDSWPSLPPHIVQAILALVRTARG